MKVIKMSDVERRNINTTRKNMPDTTKIYATVNDGNVCVLCKGWAEKDKYSWKIFPNPKRKNASCITDGNSYGNATYFLDAIRKWLKYNQVYQFENDVEFFTWAVDYVNNRDKR